LCHIGDVTVPNQPVHRKTRLRRTRGRRRASHVYFFSDGKGSPIRRTSVCKLPATTLSFRNLQARCRLAENICSWRRGMSKLTSKTRDKLPASAFAGPGRSYPVPDKAHAVDAKARASQAVKAGRLSKGQASKIDAKANKVIKESAKH
jgi:hypothetical protein